MIKEYRKRKELFKLIESMNSYASFDEMLAFIHQTFIFYIPYNYIGIALIDSDKKKLTASYGVSDKTIVGLPGKLIGKTYPVQETSLENVIQAGIPRIINDLETYGKAQPFKPYNQIILESGIRASITVPLAIGNEPMGVIFFSSSKKNVYKKRHIQFLQTLANSIAISFKQNIFINDLLYSTTLSLAKLAEARDEDTGEHLERMQAYARLIATLLFENKIYEDELTYSYIEEIEKFSPLHDIGKVGVKDGILLKPGKLTKEEFEEMKKHTLYGAEVLSTAQLTIQRHGKPIFQRGIEIAKSHQEKWDGSGYPEGLKGDQIPLSARIVAVADVFDALTSKRPYKDAFPFEQSFQIILEGSGTHFDPNIVRCFKENKEKIYKKYKTYHK
jgi:response regulator RpfG family c-di-GMP phosphodiesterase